MDRKTIGQRLRTAREAIGFTQEQVAKFLELKRENISYFETGSRPIDTLTLQKIAELYGYKISYFIQETVKDTEPQVSMAFRFSELSENDVKVIAQVKKIALNYNSLRSLLGNANLTGS